MDHFAKIFSKKLEQLPNHPTTPVACSIPDVYQTQQQLLTSAQQRQLSTHHKNTQIATTNLQYRSQLQQKLDLLQKKHQKRRTEQINKVVKNQDRKIKYVQEIHLKANQNDKNTMREHARLQKQHQQDMQQFWNKQKQERQHSQRAQTAAKPLYQEAYQRKKSLEQREGEGGLRVKSELIKKHTGREQLVFNIINHKQQEIHSPHNQLIEQNIKKHQQILRSKQERFINNLGQLFQTSKNLLKQTQKTWQSKHKDKLIDDQQVRHTIQSNFLQRNRNRSASLADCKCKRINNVEQGLTRSIPLAQHARHSLFTDTLKQHQKTPSELAQQRSHFMTRSQSLRSTVSNNQERLRERRYNQQTEQLRRQRQITEALNLKKSIQVEGNCYVRLLNVK